MLPPLSTLGPSGPSEAPLPRLSDAAIKRSSGRRGAAGSTPSAIAIRLGRLGPRSRPSWRSSPTHKPPSTGASKTGQDVNQPVRPLAGTGSGAGGSGGGGRKPMPPRPISTSAFSGVPEGAELVKISAGVGSG